MSSRFAVPKTAPSNLLSTLVVALIAVLGAALMPAAALSQDAPAQDKRPVSDEYRKTLSRLLEVIGADVAGEQIAYAVAQETLGGIAATGTPVTEQVQQIVVDAAIKEYVPKFGNIEYLTNLYAPLYAEQLSKQEITELLAFYESPLGQKVLVAIPSIAQTGAMALQQAGLETIPAFQAEVGKQLNAAGVDVKPVTPTDE